MELHSALGVSAIILSATLPSDLCKSLAGAFAKGLGDKVEIQRHPIIGPGAASIAGTAPNKAKAEVTVAYCTNLGLRVVLAE